MSQDGISRAVLDQAVQVLGNVLSFQHPADSVLSRYFREQRSLGQRDRAFIAESVYAVLRRLRWLRRLAGFRATPRQLLLAWLVRGEGLSLRRLDAALNAEEKSWAGEIKAKEVGDETLCERTDLPDWLVRRLSARFDEEGLIALARGLNRPAPLDLRVNTLKMSRDAVLAALAESGVEASAGAFSPGGSIFRKRCNWRGARCPPSSAIMTAGRMVTQSLWATKSSVPSIVSSSSNWSIRMSFDVQ